MSDVLAAFENSNAAEFKTALGILGGGLSKTQGRGTQVLENLAKGGVPSRAEISDAAIAGRAECVMLNKGPHIVKAVRVLDDILRRMQGHQSKKRSMLRPLAVAQGFDSKTAAPAV